MLCPSPRSTLFPYTTLFRSLLRTVTCARSDVDRLADGCARGFHHAFREGRGWMHGLADLVPLRLERGRGGHFDDKRSGNTARRVTPDKLALLGLLDDRDVARV